MEITPRLGTLPRARRRDALTLLALAIVAAVLAAGAVGAGARMERPVRTHARWSVATDRAARRGLASLCIGGGCPAVGIHKIRHVVIIMQENRSFDSYFGTYPGADGLPMRGGVPKACVPDPAAGVCLRPYHSTTNRDRGGPHGYFNAVRDIHGGAMNGFVAQAEHAGTCAPNDPSCGRRCQPGETACTDVMGYHDASEIPNYWSYAHNFVLQDHMFASARSWSLPEHLYEVSGWSAFCPVSRNPLRCRNNAVEPGLPKDFGTAARRARTASEPGPFYSWTDVTYLLHRFGVSWRYYVLGGNEPDCENDMAITCTGVSQSYRTPGIWNPLPHFADVHANREVGNVRPLGDFLAAAHRGDLPAVSWVAPNDKVSEHPPALISTGQAFVTTLVNAVMSSPDWNSTAIFISWDDWGGFYDHVVPPRIDGNGYGLRVPGLVISPYARQGYVDHQVLSHDAYLKFIEDDFLGGRRLDPATDGRPDPRPSVRENAPQLGSLASDFDFRRPPRAPVLLAPDPGFS